MDASGFAPEYQRDARSSAMRLPRTLRTWRRGPLARERNCNGRAGENAPQDRRQVRDLAGGTPSRPRRSSPRPRRRARASTHGSARSRAAAPARRSQAAARPRRRNRATPSSPTMRGGDRRSLALSLGSDPRRSGALPRAARRRPGGALRRAPRRRSTRAGSTRRTTPPSCARCAAARPKPRC